MSYQVPRLQRVDLVGWFVAYFLLLQAVYQFGVAPLFSYAGFVDDFNLAKFVISLLSIMLISLWRLGKDILINVYLNIIFLIIVVPSFVLYSGANLSTDFVSVTAFAFLIVTVSAISTNIPRLRIRPVSDALLGGLLFLLLLLGVSSVIAFGGLKYWNLDISKVYEFREFAAGNLPPVFSYLLAIIGKVVIPVGIVLGLRNKQAIAAIVFGAAAFVLFGLTGHKSLVLYPLLVVVFYYWLMSTRPIRVILAALIVLLVIAGIDIWLFRTESSPFAGWFSSLLVRRALFLPALLNFDYVDYFSSAEKIYWASSKLSLGLIRSPYDLQMAPLIGLEYFGSDEAWANTGWIGSGYAHAGMVGVAMYSFLIGKLIGILNLYAKRIGVPVVGSIFLIPFLTMISSADFTTVLLTHGLVVALVILVVLRPPPRKSTAEINDWSFGISLAEKRGN